MALFEDYVSKDHQHYSILFPTNPKYTNRGLRMQRFYLKFTEILHVTHLHFPFFYW